MQHDGVCNVSSCGMQSCDIIVVIGKRKSQVIEALKSNIFDVGTSEAREIKKPCPPLKLPFLLSDSVANTEKLPLSVEGSPLSVESSTESTVIHMTAVNWGGRTKGSHRGLPL